MEIKRPGQGLVFNQNVNENQKSWPSLRVSVPLPGGSSEQTGPYSYPTPANPPHHNPEIHSLQT